MLQYSSEKIVPQHGSQPITGLEQGLLNLKHRGNETAWAVPTVQPQPPPPQPPKLAPYPPPPQESPQEPPVEAIAQPQEGASTTPDEAHPPEQPPLQLARLTYDFAVRELFLNATCA